MSEFAMVDGVRHVVSDGVLKPLVCGACGANALPTHVACSWGPKGAEPICADCFSRAQSKYRVLR